MKEENVSLRAAGLRPLGPARNIGRFIIDDLLMENWRLLKHVMQHMVVVQVTRHYDTRTTEYMAFSDYFDEVPDGEEAPLYRVILEQSTTTTIGGGGGRPTLTMVVKRVKE